MTLPFPKRVLAQHTILLGKTRSGKSSTMRVMVEALLDDKKPVCIMDPKGDWWGIKSSADGKKPGYDVVIFGGSHADVPINPQSGKVVAELVATGNRPALIDLGGWMVGDRTRFFIDFASMLFVKTHGHRWLAIDECHNFAPQGKVIDPQAGLSLHWANRLASEGAGKGLVLISASQRPQKVHKDYLTSHETLIGKRVIHKLDRDALKDWIDACGDPEQGKEVLRTLAGLQRSQGWVYSPEIKFGPKLVEFPMFKTYDSFAPQTGAQGRKLKGWASVDLDQVKEKLASVVEEAKANDPKELRAEVARLKAENAKLQSQAASAAPAKPDKDALEEARKAGFEQAKKKLTAALRKEVRGKMIEALSVTHAALVEHATNLASVIGALKKEQLTATVEFAMPAWQTSPDGKKHTLTVPPGTRLPPLVPRAVPSVLPQTPSRAKAITPIPGDGAFTAPQLKVLRSLAMWSALGHEAPTREMVAAVAGYSPSSGGYNNLLGAIKTVGAIDYPQPGRVTLVADGIGVMTRQEGAGMLWDNLSNPQRKIISALIGRGERTREEVGADTGYSSSSGGYNNLLGSLRTLGLLHYPRPGVLVTPAWADELMTGQAMAA